MPLPPALLKRLAKRGIVEKNPKDGPQQKRKPPPSQVNPTEEIIAEDYDEVEEPYEYNYDFEPQTKKPPDNFWSERLKRRIVDGNVNGYRGCPNKYNVYHKCTLYCINTFGDGVEPSKNYLKRKARLLKRYPLSADWKEIYDHGCGVHYYWNTVDDSVSWLPPSHPRAIVHRASAATLRKEMEESQPDNEENEENLPQPFEAMNVELPGVQNEGAREYSVSGKAPAMKKPKARDLDKAIRAKTERRQKRDNTALDPMDPAAYSDIPRGKWSAGLENEKTGVDSTVSGTLFQMRPYPSPGMILQANAAAAKKENQSDDSDAEDGGGNNEP